jgi:iron(III) transport system permease protein
MLLMGTPVYTIVVGLLGGPGPSWSHLQKFLLAEYTINSVVLVLGTGILSLVWGVPAAWFVSTTYFSGRKLFEWLLIMPLAIPTYIMAFTYAGIFDYTGIVQSTFRQIFNTGIVHLDILNIYGVMFIMSLALFPYVYVIARIAFLSKFRSLIEASQTLGASSSRLFFKVILPVSRPALVAGLTLVSMEVLNDYGAVKYFGVPTFTTGIFRSWFSYEDIQAAIYLSALLLLFVFLILLIEKKQRGHEKFHTATIERTLRPIQLFGWKNLLVLLCCLFPVLLGFVIPVLQLIWWAVEAYASAAHIDLLSTMINSFTLAFCAALSCVAVAVLLLFVARMQKNQVFTGAVKLSTMGYAIPGAVVAIGVLTPFLFIDKTLIEVFLSFGTGNPGLILTGTVVALIFAYTVRYLSVAFNPVEAGFEKIGQSLDEVASILKASTFSRLTSINLPLLKAALGTAAILVFVDVLKELPLTLILRPFNFHTLATRSFELASDEQVAAAAVPSLVIIFTGMIPVYLLSVLSINKSNK